MKSYQTPSIENFEIVKTARITSELAILFLCLFIIFGPIAFALRTANMATPEILRVITIILISCSLAISIISLISFTLIYLKNRNITKSILGENAQYFFLAFISFIISLSFILMPIILPFD